MLIRNLIKLLLNNYFILIVKYAFSSLSTFSYMNIFFLENVINELLHLSLFFVIN